MKVPSVSSPEHTFNYIAKLAKSHHAQHLQRTPAMLAYSPFVAGFGIRPGDASVLPRARPPGGAPPAPGVARGSRPPPPRE